MLMGRQPTTEPSPFWRRLVEAWGSQGLPTTQNGVAKKLESLRSGSGRMSQGSTRRWFTGDGLPSIEALTELASRGKVTIDWLLNGTLPKCPIARASKLERLLLIWEQLDEKRRTSLLEIAEALLGRQLAATGGAPLDDDPPIVHAIHSRPKRKGGRDGNGQREDGGT